MQNETSYIFFNLLLCGLVTGEIYYQLERSRRVGLALGLVIVGLFAALTFEESKAVLKREWLRIGAITLLIISLTCTGELVWGELHFKVIMMVILIMVGLLGTWSQGDIGNVPLSFWFAVSIGAVTATFTLGQTYVDLGAYIGAWLWIIFGFVFSRLRALPAE